MDPDWIRIGIQTKMLHQMNTDPKHWLQSSRIHPRIRTVSFWASRIRIWIRNHLCRSGSFHQQASVVEPEPEPEP
jgi:hypothetical protein